MFNYKKIYGPYKDKVGRKRIVVVEQDNTKRTISYPKYLMEVHLQRKPEKNETVDHIDRDYTNDDISNLRVVDRSKHASDDVKRRVAEKFTCPWCKEGFSLSGVKLNDATYNRRRGNAGPFCSRKCAGKYGRNVQDGGEKLEVVQLPKARYKYIEKT